MICIFTKTINPPTKTLPRYHFPKPSQIWQISFPFPFWWLLRLQTFDFAVCVCSQSCHIADIFTSLAPFNSMSRAWSITSETNAFLVLVCSIPQYMYIWIFPSDGTRVCTDNNMNPENNILQFWLRLNEKEKLIIFWFQKLYFACSPQLKRVLEWQSG